MHGDPLVSIMIPAHKPAFLKATLGSALAQNCPALEIVVSDDSDGREVETLVQVFPSDPRLSYTRHPNPSGIAGNYHRLLQLARGRWGLFLDDDDLLYPDAIATLLRAAESNAGSVLVYAGYDLMNLQTDERRQICVGQEINVRRGAEFFQQFSELPPVTVTVLFDLAVAREARIFSDMQNIKSGDWESWLKIALHGDVAYVPRITGCHYRHEQSYSMIPSLAMDIDNAVFIDRAADYAVKMGVFPTKEIELWRRRMLAWYFTWIFADHVPRRQYVGLWQGVLALLRRDPMIAFRLSLNVPLMGSALLSGFPKTHKRFKHFYRRLRFGSARAANF